MCFWAVITQIIATGYWIKTTGEVIIMIISIVNKVIGSLHMYLTLILVGFQLQVSNYFADFVIGYPHDTHVNYAHFNSFLLNFSYSF